MSFIQQKVVFLACAVCACLFLAASPSWGADGHPLRVGAAKVDITPKDLTGLLGVSNRPFQGVHDPIYARALVLDNGVTSAAIVELDLVELGDTTPLRQEIAKQLGIPADHIMIAATHDHSAPRYGPTTPGTSSALEGRPKTTDAFTKQVDDSIVEALRQAKASLQPARVGLGTGKVGVNIQRFGHARNEDGFVDENVWVLKFENLTGTPIAFLMNYAVHSTTMGGTNQIAGDLAGMASKYVEQHYQDKVVALFSMGAAADQMPKFGYDAKNPAAVDASQIEGGMVGAEVLQVANAIQTMSPVVTLQAAQRAVPCPMYQGPPLSPGGGGAAAAPTQSPLQPGATLNIQLGLIQINQIAITSVSGEVFTEIYAHLKKESPFANTMMITIANDRVGYIADDPNWVDINPAFVKGCAEKAIVGNLVEMMNATIQ